MGHAIIKIMSFFVDVWNTIENRGVNSDMETQHIIHNFEPIYNEHSKILMLGTMPSPKSREVGFYYGHPRNRFWKVVSDVCGEAYPETREGKIAFALEMVLQSGMCWRGVILKEQMTVASVIHSRMI